MGSTFLVTHVFGDTHGTIGIGAHFPIKKTTPFPPDPFSLPTSGGSAPTADRTHHGHLEVGEKQTPGAIRTMKIVVIEY